MKKIFLITILSLVSVIYAVTPIANFSAQHSIVDSDIQIHYHFDVGLSQSVGDVSIYTRYGNTFSFLAWEPLQIDVKYDFITVGVSHNIGIATLKVEHTQVRAFSDNSIFGGYTRFEIQLGD